MAFVLDLVTKLMRFTYLFFLPCVWIVRVNVSLNLLNFCTKVVSKPCPLNVCTKGCTFFFWYPSEGG